MIDIISSVVIKEVLTYSLRIIQRSSWHAPSLKRLTGVSAEKLSTVVLWMGLAAKHKMSSVNCILNVFNALSCCQLN